MQNVLILDLGQSSRFTLNCGMLRIPISKGDAGQDLLQDKSKMALMTAPAVAQLTCNRLSCWQHANKLSCLIICTVPHIKHGSHHI